MSEHCGCLAKCGCVADGYYYEEGPKRQLHISVNEDACIFPTLQKNYEEALEAIRRLRSILSSLIGYWNGEDCGYCDAKFKIDDDNHWVPEAHMQGCWIGLALSRLKETERFV